jgi:hypothetical protein
VGARGGHRVEEMCKLSSRGLMGRMWR